MTAIACRAGWLAADSGSFVGELSFGTKKKIHRLSDGSLYAGAGEAQIVEAVCDWLDGGHIYADRPAPPKDEDDFGGIWLRRIDGEAQIWLIHDRIEPYRCEDEFVAEGSHPEFCLGAMAAGASAEEAVRLAVLHGVWARGPVVVERLE